MGEEDKIAITQPRRVAARSVARYVAEQAGSRVGDEVGYNIRFEDRTTEGTRVNFMTDGILLRKIQEDPLLKEYMAVMVDEVHERSLNIDFILSLLKQVQKKREEAGLPPLKIVVTSATLEKEKLAAYFDGSPVVEVPGRLHPVDVHYEERTPHDYTEAAAQKVQDIVQGGKEGDILIFMPGTKEIDQTIKKIEALGIQDIDILPLHGQLSPEDQDRIFSPSGRRKVIVSTNVAETSVTVPGVRHVIDSGLIKQVEFDPETGIESLTVRQHAKSGCVQRAGRAGRVAPGDCHRLYSENDFNDRREFQLPEIQRSNLAHVVLTMKKMGIENVEEFDFIDPPDSNTLNQAINTLKTLGALDEQGQMTEIGNLMAELPLEPHVARMVIEANKYGCVEQVCTIAAFLGGRYVFNRPRDKQSEADMAHGQFKVEGSDFLTLLNVWRQAEEKKFNESWARDNFLSIRVLKEAREIRNQLFRALKRNGIRAEENDDPEAVGKSIAAGLVGNLMEYSSRHSYRMVGNNSGGYYIHPSSVTFGGNHPQFVVAAEIIQTDKTYARGCQVIKPEWIHEIAPQLVREEGRTASYDSSTDRVVKGYDLYLKGSYGPYASESREITGDEAVEAFANALASERVDIPFVAQNKQVLATLKDFYVRSGGQTPEPLSSSQLAEIYKQRLGTYASRKELTEALEAGQIDLSLNLDEYLQAETREQVMRDNPETIQIGEKNYTLNYADSGWGTDRFTVKMKVPAADILTLQEMPHIPSGRQITIEVVDKEGSSYTQFSGKDLAELKAKSKAYLIKEQYGQWRITKPSGALEQPIEGFDPLTNEIPPMPEPIEFGTDPETGESLYAYPAISVTRSYHHGDHYFIKFYPTEQEAQKAQAKVEEICLQARERQHIEQEHAKLLLVVRALYASVQALSQHITGPNYAERGYSYKESFYITNQLGQARHQLEQDPKKAQEILNGIQEFILSKEQELLDEQQESQRALEAVQPKLDIIGGKVTELKTMIESLGLRIDSLPVGAQELIQRWEKLESDMSQRRMGYADIGKECTELELLARQINPNLIKDYLEKTSEKNWGIYGKVSIVGGVVSEVNEYGERVPTSEIIAGKSDRNYLVNEMKDGRIRLRPNRNWGQIIILENGEYAIGRDGTYVYEVKFDEQGNVYQIFEKLGDSYGEEQPQALEMPTGDDVTLPDDMESDDDDATVADLLGKFGSGRRGRNGRGGDEGFRKREEQQSVIDRTLASAGDGGRENGTEVRKTLLEEVQSLDTDALIEKLNTLKQNKKQRKRAFIQAAIICRGLDAVSTGGISESDFLTIFQQLRQARQEVNGSNTQAQEELDVAIREVENVYSVLKASRNEVVLEYIGEGDEEGLRRFQDILLSLVQQKDRVPKGEEMSQLIEQALEQMTG